jgi:hypothetical protein
MLRRRFRPLRYLLICGENPPPFVELLPILRFAA